MRMICKMNENFWGGEPKHAYDNRCDQATFFLCLVKCRWALSLQPPIVSRKTHMHNHGNRKPVRIFPQSKVRVESLFQ